MAVLNTILTKIFGNKYERDLRELQPYLEKIIVEYENIKQLDNDRLRAKTKELKQKIEDYISGELQKIAELKKNIEEEPDVNEKEKIYDEIDKIEKEIDNKIEEVLDDSIPTAFSIIKETAKRFKEKPEIEVTATDFDKNLAAEKNYVEIRGNKAIYKNSWIAGGNEITWDMVHYDVQLIVLISTSLIPRPGEKHTMPILPMALTMNLVSITSGTTWPSALKTWFSGDIIMPLWMRLTLY